MVRDQRELAIWRAQLIDRDQRPLIGFVPTMGSLHEGHLSLIREAKRRSQYVVVSVFVNPTQFNQTSDFESYPRDEFGDVRSATEAGADLVFIPEPKVVYPSGAQTWVNVGTLGDHLCGATRPGHFRGVCTVVTALFNLVQCQIALFGEKDYQQLRIIRQMTRDLHLPIEIIAVPTAREESGLAMSSRNTRLSKAGQQEAASIYRALCSARSLWVRGERRLSILSQSVISELSDHAQIDYLTFSDPDSLQPLTQLDEHSSVLIAIACFIEGVRLIDNLVLDKEVNLCENSQSAHTRLKESNTQAL